MFSAIRYDNLNLVNRSSRLLNFKIEIFREKTWYVNKLGFFLTDFFSFKGFKILSKKNSVGLKKKLKQFPLKFVLVFCLKC